MSDKIDFSPVFNWLDDAMEQINSINKPDNNVEVFYESMSGGLVWRDETNNNIPIKAKWALRYIYAYRTSLLLGEPKEDYAPVWEYGLKAFPDWIGFLPERREPTSQLLTIYHRGDIKLRNCLKAFDQETDT